MEKEEYIYECIRCGHPYITTKRQGVENNIYYHCKKCARTDDLYIEMREVPNK